jgi:hypothetical protein
MITVPDCEVEVVIVLMAVGKLEIPYLIDNRG